MFVVGPHRLLSLRTPVIAAGPEVVLRILGQGGHESVDVAARFAPRMIDHGLKHGAVPGIGRSGETLLELLPGNRLIEIHWLLGAPCGLRPGSPFSFQSVRGISATRFGVL